MFLINSNNLFYIKNIIKVLNYKKIYFTLDNSVSHHSTITMEFSPNNLKIFHDDQNLLIKLPVSFNDIYLHTFNLLKNFNITNGSLNYNPIQQIISFNDKSLKLTGIHDSLINNLLLCRDGIEKLTLYRLIWPQDKEISINKIETHITNLKNKLSIHLDYELLVTSVKGRYYLRIN